MLQNRKGALFYTMMVAEIMILLAFVVIISYRQSQADLNEIKTAVSQMSEKGKNTILIKTEGEVSDKVKKFLYGSDTISDPWSKLVNIETIDAQLIEFESREQNFLKKIGEQEKNIKNTSELTDKNKTLIAQSDTLNSQLDDLKSEKKKIKEQNTALGQENTALRDNIKILEENLQSLQQTIEAFEENAKKEDRRKIGGYIPCWYYVDQEENYRPAPFLHVTITSTHYIVAPIWKGRDDEMRRKNQAELLNLPDSRTKMTTEKFKEFGNELYKISLKNDINGATDLDEECRFFVDTNNKTDSDKRRKTVEGFFLFRSYTSKE